MFGPVSSMIRASCPSRVSLATTWPLRRLFSPPHALQVRGNCVGAARLALVVGRRLGALGRRDFQVVAEDLVGGNPPPAHARPLARARLERGDPLASVASHGAALVELGRDAGL